MYSDTFVHSGRVGSSRQPLVVYSYVYNFLKAMLIVKLSMAMSQNLWYTCISFVKNQ